MKKPKPRRKPARPVPNRPSNTQPAPEPLPKLAPNPALPEAERELDLLLRLWADTRRSIPDIAAALHRSMPSLMALLQRPDIRALIDELSELLDLRARQAALSKVPRALDTLEAVLTEAAEETEPEPGSEEDTPDALKARQRASHRRNHRRLAANAILNHLRTLRYGLTPSRLAARIESPGGMATQRVAMDSTDHQPAPPSPEQTPQRLAG